MEASDWIAICAGFIALASFFVSFQQIKLTRKHNRLSVKPVISIYRKEFTTEPFEYVLSN